MWHWLQDTETSAVVWGLDWAEMSKRPQLMLVVGCNSISGDSEPLHLCVASAHDLDISQHGAWILRGSLSKVLLETQAIATKILVI